MIFPSILHASSLLEVEFPWLILSWINEVCSILNYAWKSLMVIVLVNIKVIWMARRQGFWIFLVFILTLGLDRANWLGSFFKMRNSGRSFGQLLIKDTESFRLLNVVDLVHGRLAKPSLLPEIRPPVTHPWHARRYSLEPSASIVSGWSTIDPIWGSSLS